MLKGFGSVRLSTLVGLLVAAAGMTSAAAMTNAFVGYLQAFAEVDRLTAMTLTVVALGAIAAIGIAESVAVASVITLIEIFGLLLVVGVNWGSFALLPARIGEFLPPADFAGWGPILAGAMLAFYAFLGFEDMVVVAEEVKNARRSLPLAILATLAITTVLYLLVMTVALLAMAPAELAAGEAPLAALYEKGSGASPMPINAIAAVAILNGALVQIIMASRMLYGLASKRQIPAVLAYVNPRTHTPLLATLVTTLLILLLSLPGTLRGLAQATSIVMLTVFALVNLSAWRVKRSMPAERGLRFVPAWVPLAGFLITVAFVLRELAP